MPSKNKGQFKKGHIPWNKGRSVRLSPHSEFKPGEHVGKEHPSWKGGVQVTSNDGVYIYTGINKRIRRPRKIYEDHHGPIPKGYVIYHKDGDKLNDQIENLEAISRKELLQRNNEVRQ